MKRLLVLGVLLMSACKHPAARPPGPTGAVPTATPTTDPLPDNPDIVASMTTDRYVVEVLDGGMVRWKGLAHVQSIGERHGRLAPETMKALFAEFDAAHFVTLEQQSQGDDCPGDPWTTLTYWHGEQGNSIEDPHCPQDPALARLESRFAELVGLDQWIAGNPPAPGGPLPDGSHRIVTFSRGPCFGECPFYELTVYDDGTVQWIGQGYVAKPGELRATLPAETLAALTAAFEQARFWELDEKGEIPTPCEGCVYGISSCTDTSHAITTFQQGDRVKTLDDAHCGDASPLTALEQQIDTLVGDAPWIANPP